MGDQTPKQPPSPPKPILDSATARSALTESVKQSYGAEVTQEDMSRPYPRIPAPPPVYRNTEAMVQEFQGILGGMRNARTLRGKLQKTPPKDLYLPLSPDHKTGRQRMMRQNQADYMNPVFSPEAERQAKYEAAYPDGNKTGSIFGVTQVGDISDDDSRRWGASPISLARSSPRNSPNGQGPVIAMRQPNFDDTDDGLGDVSQPSFNSSVGSTGQGQGQGGGSRPGSPGGIGNVSQPAYNSPGGIGNVSQPAYNSPGGSPGGIGNMSQPAYNSPGGSPGGIGNVSQPAYNSPGGSPGGIGNMSQPAYNSPGGSPGGIGNVSQPAYNSPGGSPGGIGNVSQPAYNSPGGSPGGIGNVSQPAYASPGGSPGGIGNVSQPAYASPGGSPGGIGNVSQPAYNSPSGSPGGGIANISAPQSYASSPGNRSNVSSPNLMGSNLYPNVAGPRNPNVTPPHLFDNSWSSNSGSSASSGPPSMGGFSSPGSSGGYSNPPSNLMNFSSPGQSNASASSPNMMTFASGSSGSPQIQSMQGGTYVGSPQYEYNYGSTPPPSPPPYNFRPDLTNFAEITGSPGTPGSNRSNFSTNAFYDVMFGSPEGGANGSLPIGQARRGPPPPLNLSEPYNFRPDLTNFAEISGSPGTPNFRPDLTNFAEITGSPGTPGSNRSNFSANAFYDVMFGSPEGGANGSLPIGQARRGPPPPLNLSEPYNFRPDLTNFAQISGSPGTPNFRPDLTNFAEITGSPGTPGTNRSNFSANAFYDVMFGSPEGGANGSLPIGQSRRGPPPPLNLSEPYNFRPDLANFAQISGSPARPLSAPLSPLDGTLYEPPSRPGTAPPSPVLGGSFNFDDFNPNLASTPAPDTRSTSQRFVFPPVDNLQSSVQPINQSLSRPLDPNPVALHFNQPTRKGPRPLIQFDPRYDISDRTPINQNTVSQGVIEYDRTSFLPVLGSPLKESYYPNAGTSYDAEWPNKNDAQEFGPVVPFIGPRREQAYILPTVAPGMTPPSPFQQFVQLTSNYASKLFGELKVQLVTELPPIVERVTKKRFKASLPKEKILEVMAATVPDMARRVMAELVVNGIDNIMNVYLGDRTVQELFPKMSVQKIGCLKPCRCPRNRGQNGLPAAPQVASLDSSGPGPANSGMCNRPDGTCGDDCEEFNGIVESFLEQSRQEDRRDNIGHRQLNNSGRSNNSANSGRGNNSGNSGRSNNSGNSGRGNNSGNSGRSNNSGNGSNRGNYDTDNFLEMSSDFEMPEDEDERNSSRSRGGTGSSRNTGSNRSERNNSGNRSNNDSYRSNSSGNRSNNQSGGNRSNNQSGGNRSNNQSGGNRSNNQSSGNRSNNGSNRSNGNRSNNQGTFNGDPYDQYSNPPEGRNSDSFLPDPDSSPQRFGGGSPRN